FLVDPLDGTKEFLKRNGEFTVNIALIEHGAPVAGVVLAPALGELFYAAQGLGAFKAQADGSGAQPIRCSAAPDDAPLRVVGSRSHGLGALDAWLAALKRPYVFTAAGSSLKFCRIAEGAADVYPRFGPTSQWDTAAGQCVLEQAGGRVVAAQAQPLRYGLDRLVINPEFVAWGGLEKFI
ncbi:MAG: 3(2),5-bisphosphate nucleotidase CysQ, partial [Pseudomonadota bacterium]